MSELTTEQREALALAIAGADDRSIPALLDALAPVVARMLADAWDDGRAS